MAENGRREADLPVVNALQGTDYLRLVSSGQSKLVTPAQMFEVATSKSPASGARTRAIAARTADIANVLDFNGIDPTGNSDSTAAIQAALNQARAVWVPTGRYAYSALTVGAMTRLFGDGRGTELRCFAPTGDSIVIGDGVTTTHGVTLDDLTIRTAPGVVRTAGRMIRARRVQCSGLSRVWVGSFDIFGTDNATMWDGVAFEGFATCWMQGGGIVGMQGEGLRLYGVDGQYFGVEFDLGHGASVAACGGYGVHIAGSSGGVYLNRSNIESNAHGVVISTESTGALNREIFLTGSILDSNVGHNLWVKPNAVDTLVAPSAWFRGSGSPGVASVQLDAGGYTATFGQVRCDSNKGDGFRIDGGNVQMDGGTVDSNGLGAGGGSGIVVGAGNYGLRTSRTLLMVGNSRYGIDLSAAGGSFDVSGDARSNTLGAVKSSTQNDAAHRVHNLLGYVDRNSSSFVILAGVESATVAHGLTETPASVEIWRYNAGDGTGGPHYVDNTTINATSFVAHNGVLAGAARAFGFTAIRNPAG